MGLGRLGPPVAACFAARGFQVVGYDPVPEKVDAVNERRSLAHEPGLDEVYEQAGARLRATTDLEDAVMSSEVTVIAVPTPSAPDGSFSLEHVIPTCRQVGALIRKKPGYHLVVLTSTVMPGSTERRVLPALEESSGRRLGEDLGLCYSAVYVTLGHVIDDFLRPDMALVGECDPRSGEMLEAIYRDVCENDPPVVRMSTFNAELTKIALNVFVATKISFANIIARMCEQMPGGDVDVVTNAMQLDERVGRGALCGAISYGGPFFSRDNQAFGSLMRRLDVATQLLEEMGRFNRSQVPWLADFIHERLPHGGRVGVLGLAYRPDTDVVTASPSIYLCRMLDERGVRVVAHDPASMDSARDVLPDSVELVESGRSCIEACDLVILITPWEEYQQQPAEVWAREGNPRIVIDCWRCMSHLADEAGVRYVPLGAAPGSPVSTVTTTTPWPRAKRSVTG